MARAIRTYSMADRAVSPDFSIRDEKSVTRIAEAHRHEYFQIQLNLAGRTTQHIAASSRPLGPGGLGFVLPYRVHRVPHPPGSRFFVLSFNLDFLRPELDVHPLDLEDVPLARAPELAPFLFQEYLDFSLAGADLRRAKEACLAMQAENARRHFGSGAILRGQLLTLLGLVCRRHDKALLAQAARQAQRVSRRDALARVMRHVREHLQQRIQLADAAAAAELSPNYLAHLIKKETGKTFVDLVTERRMEKACELLAHTTDRVGDVAAAVGYPDDAYFTRRFRQRFGLTPTQYRGRRARPQPPQ
jgi:AraC-like DNA-binding protein